MDTDIELLLRHKNQTNRTQLVPPLFFQRKQTAKSALRAFRSGPLGAGVTPAARREGDLIK
jgi:hypothetical protein